MKNWVAAHNLPTCPDCRMVWGLATDCLFRPSLNCSGPIPRLGVWGSCQWLGIRPDFLLGTHVSSNTQLASHNLAVIWQRSWGYSKLQIDHYFLTRWPQSSATPPRECQITNFLKSVARNSVSAEESSCWPILWMGLKHVILVPKALLCSGTNLNFSKTVDNIKVLQKNAFNHRFATF